MAQSDFTENQDSSKENAEFYELEMPPPLIGKIISKLSCHNYVIIMSLDI